MDIAGRVPHTGAIRMVKPPEHASDEDPTLFRRERAADGLPPTASAPNQRTLREAYDEPPRDRSGLLPGALLGNYQVIRRIGAGGMGVVYEAIDRRHGYHVAVKLLYETDARGLARLSREFRRMADISHPNLVALYELGGERQHRFIAMEFIAGADFVTGVRPGGRLDQRRLRAATRQLTLGVHALHEHGRVHRDLKPSNVMMASDSGRVVVLDFGLVDEIGRKTMKSTSMGLVQGTPAYMAPEQAAGQLATPASDWYAVGVMLYEAVTGKLPFVGPLMEILIDKQFRDPPLASTREPTISPELDSLIAMLLARDPALRPAAPELIAWCDGRLLPPERRSRPPPPPSPTLIGLDRARALLEDAYQAVGRRRSPVVVDVFGPSGTGKTALIEAFVDDLRRRENTVVLTGRCYEQESVDYKAFDSLMAALARHMRRMSPEDRGALQVEGFAALVQLFPVLAEVGETLLEPPRERAREAAPRSELSGLSGLAAAFAADAAAQIAAEAPPEAAAPRPSVPRDMSRETGSSDQQAQRARAFRGLKRVLYQLALRVHLVLVVDDLQWGDRDSAQLLAELFAPPAAPPLLFVGAWRSEDAERSPLLRGLTELRGIATPAHAIVGVETRPLVPEEATRLALLRLGRDDVGAQGLARAIAHESAGNPMLIEALVQHADPLVDPSTLRSSTDAQVPSLEQLIERRLRRLDLQATEVLELVAVAGQPVTLELLGRTLPGDLRPVLGQLRSERLIRTTTDGEPAIECYHDRIRVAALRSLDPPTLIARHAALAAALLASGRDEPERLARHLFAAEQHEQAAEYATHAAQAAEQALAFARAASLYRLAGVCRPGDWTLRRRAGDALVLAGRSGEAAPLFVAAAELAPPDMVTRMQRAAAEQFLISGHIDEGLAVLRPLLAESGLPYPEQETAAVALLGSQMATLAARGAEFRKRAESQLPAHLLAAVDTCWIAGKGLLLADPVRGGYYMVQSALLALTLGSPRRIARGLAVVAAVGASRSAMETREWLLVAEQLAGRLGDPYTQGLVAVSGGIVLRSRGNWRDAYDALDEGLQLLRSRCPGAVWECSLGSASLLITLEALGEIRALTVESGRLAQQAQDSGDLHTGVIAAIYGALALLARDDVAAARARLQHALTAWPGRSFQVHQLHALKLMVDCDLYAGDPEAAWSRVVAAWSSIESASFLRIAVRRMEALQLRTRAALAMLRHDPQGHAHLQVVIEADLEQIGREPMSYAPPLAALLRAGLAAVSDDRAAVLESLAPAIYGLETAGMAIHANVARRCKGEWTGGPQGEATVAQAESFMRMQDIARPACWARMVAPGLVRG